MTELEQIKALHYHVLKNARKYTIIFDTDITRHDDLFYLTNTTLQSHFPHVMRYILGDGDRTNKPNVLRIDNYHYHPFYSILELDNNNEEKKYYMLTNGRLCSNDTQIKGLAFDETAYQTSKHYSCSYNDKPKNIEKRITAFDNIIKKIETDLVMIQVALKRHLIVDVANSIVSYLDIFIEPREHLF